MRFLRFHLSTLLLLCVFTGAAIGLSFTPPVWERVKDIRRYQGFDNPFWIDHSARSHTFGGEKVEHDDVHKGALIFSAVDAATTAETPLYRIERRGGFCSMRFSKDGQFFAVEGPGGPDEVYHRTRGYGWKGLMELPLLWVAAASFLGLFVVFARRVVSLLRKRTEAPRPITLAASSIAP